MTQNNNNHNINFNNNNSNNTISENLEKTESVNAKDELLRQDMMKKLSLKEKWLHDNSNSPKSDPFKSLDKSKEHKSFLGGIFSSLTNFIKPHDEGKSDKEGSPKRKSSKTPDKKSPDIKTSPEKKNSPERKRSLERKSSIEKKSSERKTSRERRPSTERKLSHERKSSERKISPEKIPSGKKSPDKKKTSPEKISAGKNSPDKKPLKNSPSKAEKRKSTSPVDMDFEKLLEDDKELDVDLEKLLKSEKPPTPKSRPRKLFKQKSEEIQRNQEKISLPKSLKFFKQKSEEVREEADSMLSEIQEESDRLEKLQRELEIKRFSDNMNAIKSCVVDSKVASMKDVNVNLSKYFPSQMDKKPPTVAKNREKALKDVNLSKYFSAGSSGTEKKISTTPTTPSRNSSAPASPLTPRKNLSEVDLSSYFSPPTPTLKRKTSITTPPTTPTTETAPIILRKDSIKQNQFFPPANSIPPPPSVLPAPKKNILAMQTVKRKPSPARPSEESQATPVKPVDPKTDEIEMFDQLLDGSIDLKKILNTPKDGLPKDGKKEVKKEAAKAEVVASKPLPIPIKTIEKKESSPKEEDLFDSLIADVNDVDILIDDIVKDEKTKHSPTKEYEKMFGNVKCSEETVKIENKETKKKLKGKNKKTKKSEEKKEEEKPDILDKLHVDNKFFDFLTKKYWRMVEDMEKANKEEEAGKRKEEENARKVKQAEEVRNTKETEDENSKESKKEEESEVKTMDEKDGKEVKEEEPEIIQKDEPKNDEVPTTARKQSIKKVDNFEDLLLDFQSNPVIHTAAAEDPVIQAEKAEDLEVINRRLLENKRKSPQRFDDCKKFREDDVVDESAKDSEQVDVDETAKVPVIHNIDIENSVRLRLERKYQNYSIQKILKEVEKEDSSKAVTVEENKESNGVGEEAMDAIEILAEGRRKEEREKMEKKELQKKDTERKEMEMKELERKELKKKEEQIREQQKKKQQQKQKEKEEMEGKELEKKEMTKKLKEEELKKSKETKQVVDELKSVKLENQLDEKVNKMEEKVGSETSNNKTEKKKDQFDDLFEELLNDAQTTQQLEENSHEKLFSLPRENIDEIFRELEHKQSESNKSIKNNNSVDQVKHEIPMKVKRKKFLPKDQIIFANSFSRSLDESTSDLKKNSELIETNRKSTSLDDSTVCPEISESVIQEMDKLEMITAEENPLIEEELEKMALASRSNDNGKIHGEKPKSDYINILKDISSTIVGLDGEKLYQLNAPVVVRKPQKEVKKVPSEYANVLKDISDGLVGADLYSKGLDRRYSQEIPASSKYSKVVEKERSPVREKYRSLKKSGSSNNLEVPNADDHRRSKGTPVDVDSVIDIKIPVPPLRRHRSFSHSKTPEPPRRAKKYGLSKTTDLDEVDLALLPRPTRYSGIYRLDKDRHVVVSPEPIKPELYDCEVDTIEDPAREFEKYELSQKYSNGDDYFLGRGRPEIGGRFKPQKYDFESPVYHNRMEEAVKKHSYRNMNESPEKDTSHLLRRSHQLHAKKENFMKDHMVETNPYIKEMMKQDIDNPIDFRDIEKIRRHHSPSTTLAYTPATTSSSHLPSRSSYYSAPTASLSHRPTAPRYTTSSYHPPMTSTASHIYTRSMASSAYSQPSHSSYTPRHSLGQRMSDISPSPVRMPTARPSSTSSRGSSRQKAQQRENCRIS